MIASTADISGESFGSTNVWLDVALIGPAGALVLAIVLALPVVLQLPLPGISKNGSVLRGVLTVAVGLAISPALSGVAVDAYMLVHLGFTGVMLGLLIRLVWETVLVAAALLDVSLGRGSIGVQGLSESDSNGPFTSLAGLMYLSIFFISGFHLVAIAELADVASAVSVGIGRIESSRGLQSTVMDGVQVFATLFRAAVSVSLPALLVALLVDLTLGWANRTLRSLPAMFLAMPLRAMLGWLLVPATLLGAGAILVDIMTGAT